MTPVVPSGSVETRVVDDRRGYRKLSRWCQFGWVTFRNPTYRPQSTVSELGNGLRCLFGMRIAIVVLLTKALEMASTAQQALPSTTTGEDKPAAVNAGLTDDEIAVPLGRTFTPTMLGAAKA